MSIVTYMNRDYLNKKERKKNIHLRLHLPSKCEILNTFETSVCVCNTKCAKIVMKDGLQLRPSNYRQNRPTD